MDTTKQNAKQAVTLTMMLTLFVAGFELLIAFTKYRTGMNFLDLTTYVTQNKYIYLMLLMIANLALFPTASIASPEVPNCTATTLPARSAEDLISLPSLTMIT